jgi:hypothetical protein
VWLKEIEGKEKVSIFDKVLFYRKPLPKIIALVAANAYRISIYDEVVPFLTFQFIVI